MIAHLRSAIDTTVEEFRNYRFDFLSERDIQALLYANLRKATIGVRYQHNARGPLFYHPVATEHYVPGGKMDVAVLSDEPDSGSSVWRQPCRIAIEIKLWQPNYGEPSYMDDVNKLLNYQAYLQNRGRSLTGIAMLFVHPCIRLRPTTISEEKLGDTYPDNGVALHLVTQEDHWWKQIPAPSAPEPGALLAQTP